MGVMTRVLLNMHEQVVMTEGNNVSLGNTASGVKLHTLKQFPSIEETKEDDQGSVNIEPDLLGGQDEDWDRGRIVAIKSKSASNNPKT